MAAAKKYMKRDSNEALKITTRHRSVRKGNRHCLRDAHFTVQNYYLKQSQIQRHFQSQQKQKSDVFFSSDSMVIEF